MSALRRSVAWQTDRIHRRWWSNHWRRWQQRRPTAAEITSRQRVTVTDSACWQPRRRGRCISLSPPDLSRGRCTSLCLLVLSQSYFCEFLMPVWRVTVHRCAVPDWVWKWRYVSLCYAWTSPNSAREHWAFYSLSIVSMLADAENFREPRSLNLKPP